MVADNVNDEGLNIASRAVLQVNSTTYRWPNRPVVVVCVDGCDPQYIERGLEDGILPNIRRFTETGFSTVANSVVPSFTNPNNLSIVTGAPPEVHGISGNFFVDPDSGEDVMMNDPKFLRAGTILAAFSEKGAGIAAITAKDKLRTLLGHDLDLHNSVCFSSEKADQCRLEENGIENVIEFVDRPLPDVYSADLSLFVLEAGTKLLQQERFDLMYLSLTDYMQHKYVPGSPESNDFYRRLDDCFGRLADQNVVLALVADHGMSDKARPDGSPNVIYLQDLLDEQFGKHNTRVILPITDPYVVHHGSLGGFVRVHCTNEVSAKSVIDFVSRLPGIVEALDRETVCRRFHLPLDREGDVAVISDGPMALGITEAKHDLAALGGFRLRSHGGIAEQRVPFILSTPLNQAYAARAAAQPPNNYDIFEYAINGTD